MVLGIVGVAFFWLYGIVPMLAVIFGHIALHQIKQHSQRRRGTAIATLTTGYVGVACGVAVVAVLLFGGAVSSSSNQLAEDLGYVGQLRPPIQDWNDAHSHGGNSVEVGAQDPAALLHERFGLLVGQDQHVTARWTLVFAKSRKRHTCGERRDHVVTHGRLPEPFVAAEQRDPAADKPITPTGSGI